MTMRLSSESLTRREAMLALCGTGVSLASPPHALALVAVTDKMESQYDTPRNAMRDAAFAKGMASGMGQYEAAVAARKEELFANLWRGLPACLCLSQYAARGAPE